MVDIGKQINYWLEGGREDWEVAELLVRSGRYRHGLYFAHLALEKALKAYVCRNTRELAPRIHNLVKLAEIANITISKEQLDVLTEMNVFNIEGRYPETLLEPLRPEESKKFLLKAEEVFRWLTNQL